MEDSLRIDADVLMRQVRMLGDIGADPEAGGRTRIALTDEDQAGRDQLVAWMQELDLRVSIDGIGNIFGILEPAAAMAGAKPLMVGSHIDTVRNAGALDGCYGVLAGLAIARAYRQAGVRPHRPLAVAAFTNEEGVRFQPDMMGSLVHAGGLSLREALDARGMDGSRLGDELSRIGYAGEMKPGTLMPGEYLELHIEQGPALEAAGKVIGVVDSLQGISWQRLRIWGTANHAGTTPLHLRQDAGYAAAAIVCFLREKLAGTRTLATVGSLQLRPDLINVIPREATLTVDLRDPDEERLRNAESQLDRFLKELAGRERVKIEAERLARFGPVAFDRTLADLSEKTAHARGLSSMRMASGAGHDAQMMARIAPAAMIFVPSYRGISHNPREHTDENQLIQGAEVLLDVVRQRLGDSGSSQP